MTIKQLKRRVVQGLVEPELFYMPLGKKETRKGNLQIRLLTYSTFDIDNETIIENETRLTSGAIVVKDLKGKIIYNSKSNKDRSSFYIHSLPFGTYKVKVIRAITEMVDNQWHEVVLNNEIVQKDIVLSWFPFNKAETYIREDEELPYFCVGNYNSKYVSYTNILPKGRIYFKIYEGKKLIIDEPYLPYYQSSPRSFYYQHGILVNQYPYVSSFRLDLYIPCLASSLSVSYVLKAFNSDVETKQCNVAWTKTPCSSSKVLDLNSYITGTYQKLVDNISYAGTYDGATIYKSLKEREGISSDTIPVNVEYNCTFDGKQEGTSYNPKNFSGKNFCADYNERLFERPLSLLIKSTIELFRISYDADNEYDSDLEFNGDKYYFKNNSMFLIGYINKQEHTNEPYSEFEAYVNSKTDYEQYNNQILKGEGIDGESVKDRYEFLEIPSNTHYPYTDFISNSVLYPWLLKSPNSGTLKYVTIVSKSMNIKVYDYEITNFKENESGSICYTFPCCKNYSDDYDQY